ncbi:MAG: DUF2085 domain-containing protein [Thermoplasmatales archaeon]|nr:MAG: DUF2085 domain-containing protein [Thermoplasmatales archaeon]
MEKRERFSKIIAIFFIIFLIWILLQFSAPLFLPKGSVDNLSGHTLISDNKEITDAMPFPLNLIYGWGDRLCHQKVERSIHINGNQMPFCSRCTAIWVGLVIGIGFMIFYKLKLDEKIVILMLIGIVPLGLDGIGQLAGIWESNNFIRLITGLMMGTVCGIAIGVIIDEFRDIYHHKN